MSKTETMLLGTTAIAVIVAVYLWQQLSTERKLASGGESNTEHVLPSRQLQPASRHGESEQSNASQEAGGNPQDGPPNAAPKAERDPVTATLSSASVSSELSLGSPAYVKKWLKSAYPDLQRDTGFGEEDIEKLVGVHSSGAYPEEAERVLGIDKYQRWKEYRRAMDTSRAAIALQKTLTGAHLTDNQVQQLATVFQTEQRWYDEQLPRRPPTASDSRSKLDADLRKAQLGEERIAREIAQARSFLTEQQVSELKNSQRVKVWIDFRASLEAQRAELERTGR